MFSILLFRLSIILTSLLSLPAIAHTEARGAICLGPTLTIVPPWQWNADKVLVTVEGFPPIKFGSDREGAVVLDSLDLKKKYRVKVECCGGEVIASWTLDFGAMKTKKVQIWRSKGYWHMDPVKKAGDCG